MLCSLSAAKPFCLATQLTNCYGEDGRVRQWRQLTTGILTDAHRISGDTENQLRLGEHLLQIWLNVAQSAVQKN